MSKDCGLTGITFTEPSQTHVAQASQCDLRNIVATFMRTGVLPESRPGAMEGDFTNCPQTFEEAQAAVIPFKQSWDQLSPDDKAKFNNSLEEYALRTAVPEAFKDPDDPKSDDPKPDDPKPDDPKPTE